MKTAAILDELAAQPYTGPVSRRTWTTKIKRIITLNGDAPIKARYDRNGDCLICGEAGRCPGWHTQDDMPPNAIGDVRP